MKQGKTLKGNSQDQANRLYLAYMYQVHIEGGGGLARYDPEEVTLKINRTPMSAIGYRYAVEVLKDRVRSVVM